MCIVREAWAAHSLFWAHTGTSLSTSPSNSKFKLILVFVSVKANYQYIKNYIDWEHVIGVKKNNHSKYIVLFFLFKIPYWHLVDHMNVLNDLGSRSEGVLLLHGCFWLTNNNVNMANIYEMFQLNQIMNQQNLMRSSTCVKSAIQRR